MKCEDGACVAEYVPGARKHRHQYRALNGFEVGQVVARVDTGEVVGTVTHLDRLAGSRVEVITAPGNSAESRWVDLQVRPVQEVAA